MNMIRRILEDFWCWITDAETWALICCLILCIAIFGGVYTILKLPYYNAEYSSGYRCVYIIEDLDGNIHEAETCGDRTCRVGNIHYTYKWRRLECEE